MTQGRILINGSYAPSILNFRGHLIRSLLKRGWEVHVSAPDATFEQRAAIKSSGAILHDVPLQRAGTSGLADLRYYFAMRRLIRSLQPDLVLGYTIKPNIWGSLAAKAETVRSASMITGLGYAFLDTSGIKHKLVSATSRILYRAAAEANDVIIFQNPDDLEDFAKAGCLRDREKAKIVSGSGVDVQHYSPTPLPNEPVFLLVARLLKSKGIREYAQAALKLLNEGINARFLLVGPVDPTPDSIDPDELALWRAKGIEYRDFAHDVRGAISEASVFVLPSYREGTPRTVLEASAMGRPTITTNAPGCKETVVDEKTGILVPVGDVEALAVAMQSLANDSGRRAAMGQAARDYCVSKYEVDKVNQTLMGYLRV